MAFALRISFNTGWADFTGVIQNGRSKIDDFRSQISNRKSQIG